MVASITHPLPTHTAENKPGKHRHTVHVPMGRRFNYGLAVGLDPAASRMAWANDLLSWPAEPLSDREGRALRNRSC